MSTARVHDRPRSSWRRRIPALLCSPRRPTRAAAGLLALAFACLLALPASSQADTITVDTAEDHPLLTAPDGCSLRRAVFRAHLDEFDLHGCVKVPDGAERITIELPFSVRLTIDGADEDDNQFGDLDIGNLNNTQIPEPDIRIVGTGAQPSVIEQTVEDRVIDVHAGSLELENVVVTGGKGVAVGGGLRATGGDLALERSSVVGNEAEAGGGIGSHALGSGAGGGHLTLVGSTVAGNTADGDGGGIAACIPSHSLALSNSTLSGNTSGEGGFGLGGGALFLECADASTVVSTTITGNASATAGGGVALLVPLTALRGTILAGNTAPEASDCRGVFSGTAHVTSLGHNLIGDPDGCDIDAQPTDQLGVSGPGLGPLAANGGPTLTHALLAGSPAIDAGGPDCPPTDQRGVSRPQGAACDIGAFELEPAPPAPPPAAESAALPAGLEVRRARVRGNRAKRRLQVSGSLDPRAAGDRIVIRYRAAGRAIRLRPRVAEDGSFRANRRLRGRQRRAAGGRLVVRYAGNAELRATSTSLRAARRPVRLRIANVAVRGERIVIRGRALRRARGRVAVEVKFNRPDGSPAQLTSRARINRRGRFRARIEARRRPGPRERGSPSPIAAAGGFTGSGWGAAWGDHLARVRGGGGLTRESHADHGRATVA